MVGIYIYRQEISVEEAKIAAKWLIDHNGHAPQAAKVLLNSLNVAIERCEAT